MSESARRLSLTDCRWRFSNDKPTPLMSGVAAGITVAGTQPLQFMLALFARVRNMAACPCARLRRGHTILTAVVLHDACFFCCCW